MGYLWLLRAKSYESSRGKVLQSADIQLSLPFSTIIVVNMEIIHPNDINAN